MTWIVVVGGVELLMLGFITYIGVRLARWEGRLLRQRLEFGSRCHEREEKLGLIEQSLRQREKEIEKREARSRGTVLFSDMITEIMNLKGD